MDKKTLKMIYKIVQFASYKRINGGGYDNQSTGRMVAYDTILKILHCLIEGNNLKTLFHSRYESEELAEIVKG